GQEQAVTDLAIRASVRNDPRDLRLGAGQGREADAVTTGRDDPASYTQVSEAAADAPSVPFGTKRQIQLERSPEDGDAALAIGRRQAPTAVLERRCQRQPTRTSLK